MTNFRSLLACAAGCLSLAATVTCEDVLFSERLAKRGIDSHGHYNFSFYHINDVHAHLDQFAVGGTDCEDPAEGCVGGYSRVRTAVNESRRVHPDSLFLNVGDEFQGTMFFSFYEGAWKVAETLNLMGFDAMTLGNHEFDKGDKHLGEFVSNITIPIISANVHSNNPVLKSAIKPYKIFPEYELAVIGVTTNNTPGISSPDIDTVFEDPILAVQRTVDHIRGTTNITRIAAITHIGFDMDKILAEKTTGLYLIMGGHSHTLLGSMPLAESDYPTIIRNKEGEEVFIVQAYRWGEYVGYIDVAYDNEGKILAYHGAPIHLTNSTKQDPELQALVDSWRAPFDEAAKKVIGVADVILDQTVCQQRECLLGNVVCDAMVDFRINLAKSRGGVPPDFAFINSGGIRASIDEGNVTQGEILTAFPFGNEIVEIDLTGQQVWDIFEGILHRTNKHKTDGNALITSFVQVSRQIEIHWNATSPGASTGNLTSFAIRGNPIDLAKGYKAVTLDFLANNGGDNFISERLEAPTLEHLTTVLGEYVQANTPIKPVIEGRLVPVDASVFLSPSVSAAAPSATPSKAPLLFGSRTGNRQERARMNGWWF